MKKTTTTLAIVEAKALATIAADPLAEGWAKARRYAEAATLFQRASLAAQIMAGFVLCDLNKVYNRQGKRSDLGTSSHDETKLSWDDALEKYVSISRPTAYRWMEMARAAKPRLNKGDIDLGAILEKNPGALTPAEQELLKRAVHKISDGRTQMEFLLECGVTKIPPAYAKRGDNSHARDGDEPLNATPAKTPQELCMGILETLELARKDACDAAIWMQMSRQQHDDIKAAFEEAKARIDALHAKTHGRAARKG